MRSIGLAIAVAGLGTGLLAAAPARAAAPDWKAASAAYAKARDGTARAKPVSDYALCAGEWAAWDDALYDGRVTDATLAALDPDLRTASADEKVNLWRLFLGDDRARSDLFDTHRQAARAQIDRAVAGDKPALIALMGALGECQLPKDK